MAIVKALSHPCHVEAKARYVVTELLGGRLATEENDPAVTHLLARDRVCRAGVGSRLLPLTCSFKLLLAVARGVPVVDADSWLAACERSGSVAPADGHLLALSQTLAAKGLPRNSKLSDMYRRAQQEKSQGRSLLCGMPCLLSPGAAHADKLGSSLQLLLEASGGCVLPGPDENLLQASLALAAAGGYVPGDRPPGLIIVEEDAKEESGVSGKDVTWARESGFVGWPVYSKDWLIRSVLTYRPDWLGCSATV